MTPPAATTAAPSPWRAAGLLVVLLLGVGLVTSRLGLLGHELLGHGGAAMLVGGRVLDVGLFYFAGGWIRYRVPDPTLEHMLTIALGGIVIELVVGLALWILLARKPSLAAKLARGVGAALVVHAAWYLATGTWHGYGDGTLLRREFGFEVRLAIAIAGSVVALGFAFAGARAISGPLVGALPGTRRRRIALLAGALVLAGGLHAVLAVGEVALRRDAVYAAIMKPERVRIVERELAEWTAAQARTGNVVDEAQQRMREAELRRAHRDWPLQYVLGALLAIAIIYGALRTRIESGVQPVAPRTAVRAAIAAASCIALVIAVDVLLS